MIAGVERVLHAEAEAEVADTPAGPLLRVCECTSRLGGNTADMATPKRHEAIERWLDAWLGPDGRKRLEDWLCIAPIADEELLGLWIHGPLGRGRVDIDWIRRITTATTMQIEPKNRPVETLRGSSRLVVCTNGPPGTYLGRGSGLRRFGPEAAEALGQRFLVLEARAESAHRIRDHADEREQLLHGDALAEHAAWLDEAWVDGERELPKGSRHAHVDGSGAEALGLDRCVTQGIDVVVLDEIVAGWVEQDDGVFVTRLRGDYVVAFSSALLQDDRGIAGPSPLRFGGWRYPASVCVVRVTNTAARNAHVFPSRCC